MSNMTSVKSALDAEIRHAKEGIAFYSTRIATLEKMIAQLDQLDGASDSGSTAKAGGKRKYTKSLKTGRKNAAAETVETESGTNAATGKGNARLPATTARFWTGLLSETPVSNKEIIKAAITELKIRPNPAELKKLKQRLANAITTMTKDGSMQSEGTGRARRFFIKKQ